MKPKHLLIPAAALLLTGLVYSGYQSAKAAINLQAKFMPKFRKLNWQELVVEIDAELQNDEPGEFTLFSPLVALHFAGREVFRLDLPEGVVTVAPFSKSRLSDLLGEVTLLRVPTARLIEMVPDLFEGVLGAFGGKFLEATLHFSGRFQAPNFPPVPFRIARKISIQSPVQ